MKYLILILFLFGCGVDQATDNNMDSVLADMSHDPSMYVIYDTVHKKYVVWDTVHKKFRIWDTVLVPKPVPVDSPYIVPRKVYIPMYIPTELRKYINDSAKYNIHFTITQK